MHFFAQIFTDEESFKAEMHRISSKLIVNKCNFVYIFIFTVISSSNTQSYSAVQEVACKIVNGSSLHQNFGEVNANMAGGIFETDLLHSDAPIFLISGRMRTYTTIFFCLGSNGLKFAPM